MARSQHVLAAGVCAIATAALPALAAEPQRAAYKAPRTAYGQPDLQGIWTNETVTRLERPAQFGERLVLTPQEVAQIEKQRQEVLEAGNRPTRPDATVEEVNKNCEVPGFSGVGCGYNLAWTDSGDRVMRVRGQGRTSFITSPANGQLPPYKDGRRPTPSADRVSDNPETRSLGERCILSFGNASGPVMLPLLYNNNYQFLQTRDSFIILVEMVHDVRLVRLSTKQHLPPGVRPWMGDSIGWYDGDTLVVETTNFPAQQARAFRGATEALKVTERLTRVGPNNIHYQFTVEDAATWERPWSGEYEFSSAPGPIYEYACHEGNYGLEGILAGARREEADAAVEAAKTAKASPMPAGR